jgi:hypothetical protein
MPTRTVRLDDETEKALREVREALGLPISEALKQGLHALSRRAREQPVRSSYEIFQELDLGPGGYALAPSTDVRGGMRRALRKKGRR